MAYDVEVVERTREDTAVVCGRVAHDGVGPFIGAALGEVMEAVGNVPVVGPPFCRIDMTGDDFLLEVGFPVAEPIEASGRVEASSLPAGEVATVLHTGSYDQVPPAYFAIESWLADHGYESTGAPWEAYLDGPEVPEPRTLVCWPCRREE
jgi:effector-binding domain-containing protein